jgi:hypothetical protein
MLHRVATRFLPMPNELTSAVRSGHVRVQIQSDGSARYFIKADCPNSGEVRKAIAQRNKWERAIAILEGVILTVAFSAACIALFHF